MNETSQVHVAIVGGGFTGLSAGYELAKQGISVAVFEAEPNIGGLAAAFDVGGEKLDRFYHHWFTNDIEVMNLIDELGLTKRVQVSPTNTGVYYANSFFRLSTPWDLLTFKPLKFLDRLRLGFLAIRVRLVTNWSHLEHMTAREWLIKLAGENVYRIVWQPLLKGKFGPYAEDVSAVWFWNKLKLRGGSRGKGGEERLAYLQGGFVAVAEALADRIRDLGGRVDLGTPIHLLQRAGNRWQLVSGDQVFSARCVILTPALPIIADMIESWAPEEYLRQLRRIRYLGNVCLILELDRPLSRTYWLNVNDPSFPFVGVIEHTNFERPESYGGKHIVYLSKYLPHTDPLYAMNAAEFLEFAAPFLKRMFPAFDKSWIQGYHLWRARWSQPVVERHYSGLLPQQRGPRDGIFICSMAQIYPEDRGTNYAIREGRGVGNAVGRWIAGGEHG